MSCESITDIVVRETGRYLPNEIYNRLFAVSPWFTLLKRGVFPGGLSEVISVLTYERSAPLAAEPTWSTMTVESGQEGGTCLPPSTKVAIGSTTRNFQLYRKVLEGPDFCAEEFRSVFALTQQLNAITEILAGYTRIEWDIRFRHEYFRGCQWKVVCANISCPPPYTSTTATTYPAIQAASQLTQGILNIWKVKLMRDGAGASAMGRVDGQAIFTLICSAETSDGLIFNNADIRQDLRWGKPSELLQAIGVERSYRGFYHVIDSYPRRFTYSAGTYTEIPAFVQSSASKGVKASVNPSWESATDEESFIFDPEVIHCLMPQPITNPAPNFNFDPVTYTGLWKALNIPDRVCNPDNNIIFHRGILAMSSMPVHPERGVAFVHLRCDPPCNLITACAS